MKKYLFLLSGLVLFALFTTCTPIEGTILEVLEKAGGGGIRYTVTFNSNGGTSVPSQKVKEGELASRPQNPTRGADLLANWYSDALLEDVYNFSTPVTKDITLYAKWIAEDTPLHQVIFDSKGGSFVDAQLIYQGEKAYRPDDPVKRGCEFGGWYTTDGDPPTNVYNFGIVLSNITLYAKWDKVTIPYGDTLAEKFAWLESNAISDTTYTVQAETSESLGAQSLSYPGYTNIIIKLIGSSSTSIYRISLSGNGSMFTISDGVNLTLEKSISLEGHTDNNAALIQVDSGGNLVIGTGGMALDYPSITNNTNLGDNMGALNRAFGGGVYVNGGTFTMTYGSVLNNTATTSGVSAQGGGVCIGNNGTFKMSGGRISGNTVSTTSSTASTVYGGGVAIYNGTFEMSGGTISGNTASGNSNIIANNPATCGGGVFVFGSSGIFKKTGGGTINGNILLPLTNNAVRDRSTGSAINNQGHAAFVSNGLNSKYKDGTAGTSDDLVYDPPTISGWD